VEILVDGERFWAWSSPLSWQRWVAHARVHQHYAGVTDPWAWLVEGRVRSEGGRWEIALASAALPVVPRGGHPAAALERRAAAAALVEQARRVAVEAGLVEGWTYDRFPIDVKHDGLGVRREVTGWASVEGRRATLRLGSVAQRTTDAVTVQFDAEVADGRVSLARPLMVAREHWTMSDREGSVRGCESRGADGQLHVFRWMVDRIVARGGQRTDLRDCDPADARGCRLGTEGEQIWYGRCWWDRAGEDDLLGPKPLPVSRVRYWATPR